MYADFVCVTFIHHNITISPGGNILTLLTYWQCFVHN